MSNMKDLFWKTVENALSDPQKIDNIPEEITRCLEGNAQKFFNDVKSEQHIPRDYSLLGLCYEYGIGTEINKDFAKKSFRKAAELGDPIGQFCYADEIENDDKESFHWQLKAAAQGIALAQAAVGYFLGKNYGDWLKQNAKQGFYWAKQSAESSHFAGQWALARNYRKAVGTDRDLHKAISLLRKSTDQGFMEAFETLKKIFQKR
ncbi:hypothetical protein G9A89_020477 [Geosiphon pyriformis]|nr:hypothetical protein G9A89_020477 [Geosiphon pyriformis]